MNKKILIGSVIAVAILVLVSFTGVVGYQTTKSSTIAKASPLFTVRSSRAIQKDSEDFTDNYLGKGKKTNIYLPKSIDKIDKIETLINLLKKMDDKTIQILVPKIMYHLNKNEDINRFNNEQIYFSLKTLKDNPDCVLQLARKDYKMSEETFYFSCGSPPKWCEFWITLIGYFYAFFFGMAVYMYVFITSIFNCDPNLP